MTISPGYHPWVLCKLVWILLLIFGNTSFFLDLPFKQTLFAGIVKYSNEKNFPLLTSLLLSIAEITRALSWVHTSAMPNMLSFAHISDHNVIMHNTSILYYTILVRALIDVCTLLSVTPKSNARKIFQWWSFTPRFIDINLQVFQLFWLETDITFFNFFGVSKNTT